MIESLRTTQIAFSRFATPSGFLGGGGEVLFFFTDDRKLNLQLGSPERGSPVKSVESHMHQERLIFI